jgi:hypothetical protein
MAPTDQDGRWTPGLGTGVVNDKSALVYEVTESERQPTWESGWLGVRSALEPQATGTGDDVEAIPAGAAVDRQDGRLDQGHGGLAVHDIYLAPVSPSRTSSRGEVEIRSRTSVAQHDAPLRGIHDPDGCHRVVTEPLRKEIMVGGTPPAHGR